MKRFFVLVLLVGGLLWAGWLQFGNRDGDPSVTIDTSKVKEDTNAIVEKGKKVLDRVADEATGADSSDVSEADSAPGSE